MRILFVTEGTYPYVVGGVSTWSDQLIRGLGEHRFVVMSVVGPKATPPVYEYPDNLEAVHPVPIWRPRPGVSRANEQVARAFEEGLVDMMGFLAGDTRSFAKGALSLARLGERYDLWPLFKRSFVTSLVLNRLAKGQAKAPSLAEVFLCVNWLQCAVGPLLFVPPKTDLVHVVSNGLSALPAFAAAQLHRVPLVLTEHGVYLRERYLAFASEADSPALKRFRAAFYKTLALVVYAQADRVASVSEFNKQWQLELGSDPARTHVIPNGVDPQSFPVAPRSAQAVPTVVWVGRVDPLKDVETLVSAFKHVVDTLPTARLRLFGPVPRGNEAYQARLNTLVDSLQLGANVCFEGPVKPVSSAYYASDVVALSSVSEGFPYTVIEAMMCGKPVVATRVGGVGEAVGDTGALVPVQNPAALGDALTALLVNPTLRATLGERARARALEHFTLQTMLKAHRDLYNKALDASVVSQLAPVFSQVVSQVVPQPVAQPPQPTVNSTARRPRVRYGFGREKMVV
ncbi:GT4 family glycosyltransferase PelF [soil metagenome]